MVTCYWILIDIKIGKDFKKIIKISIYMILKERMKNKNAGRQMDFMINKNYTS